MPSPRMWQLTAALLVVALLLATVLAVAAQGHAAPAAPTSSAAIAIPNPFQIHIPGPADLAGKVFEFFFKTFFGIGAKVTRSVVEWLLATPIYADGGSYAELN